MADEKYQHLLKQFHYILNQVDNPYLIAELEIALLYQKTKIQKQVVDYKIQQEQQKSGDNIKVSQTQSEQIYQKKEAPSVPIASEKQEKKSSNYNLKKEEVSKLINLDSNDETADTLIIQQENNNNVPLSDNKQIKDTINNIEIKEKTNNVSQLQTQLESQQNIALQNANENTQIKETSKQNVEVQKEGQQAITQPLISNLQAQSKVQTQNIPQQIQQIKVSQNQDITQIYQQQKQQPSSDQQNTFIILNNQNVNQCQNEAKIIQNGFDNNDQRQIKELWQQKNILLQQTQKQQPQQYFQNNIRHHSSQQQQQNSVYRAPEQQVNQIQNLGDAKIQEINKNQVANTNQQQFNGVQSLNKITNTINLPQKDISRIDVNTNVTSFSNQQNNINSIPKQDQYRRVNLSNQDLSQQLQRSTSNTKEFQQKQDTQILNQNITKTQPQNFNQENPLQQKLIAMNKSDYQNIFNFDQHLQNRSQSLIKAQENHVIAKNQMQNKAINNLQNVQNNTFQQSAQNQFLNSDSKILPPSQITPRNQLEQQQMQQNIQMQGLMAQNKIQQQGLQQQNIQSLPRQTSQQLSLQQQQQLNQMQLNQRSQFQEKLIQQQKSLMLPPLYQQNIQQNQFKQPKQQLSTQQLIQQEIQYQQQRLAQNNRQEFDSNNSKNNISQQSINNIQYQQNKEQIDQTLLAAQSQYDINYELSKNQKIFEELRENLQQGIQSLQNKENNSLADEMIIETIQKLDKEINFNDNPQNQTALNGQIKLNPENNIEKFQQNINTERRQRNRTIEVLKDDENILNQKEISEQQHRQQNQQPLNNQIKQNSLEVPSDKQNNLNQINSPNDLNQKRQRSSTLNNQSIEQEPSFLKKKCDQNSEEVNVQDQYEKNKMKIESSCNSELQSDYAIFLFYNIESSDKKEEEQYIYTYIIMNKQQNFKNIVNQCYLFSKEIKQNYSLSLFHSFQEAIDMIKKQNIPEDSDIDVFLPNQICKLYVDENFTRKSKITKDMIIELSTKLGKYKINTYLISSYLSS
ncbi:kinase domain protein (macronuclear) [Tetrahymena thermophila SB210]|uniref:Kinase domain protein n=1 Tax=Tetrahymena thermophila (strain SB210) TaxID=312017 RepID=I7MHI7_TETTS|nr:kinase domain protein [Tetrahymena thermophila SB210]EAR87579.2 kinase domain protein [Tetrahymena thermophila SB210]|eukprot:XP_001007824.2 kinase domain protein [Tetrahymena thermophila SB210]